VAPVLTRNIQPGEPALSLREYEARGGYSALRKALSLTPEEVVELVVAADLKGRGGAGFPAGVKWASLPPLAESPRPRVVLVNCDETEPGAFKDRFLAEHDPHQLLEGTLICAYACQAELAYIFVRAEYLDPTYHVLERALGELQEAGHIGREVLGNGWQCDLRLHLSAGRYICGEAQALVNAMEGRRPVPKTRPPYPTISGAWGRPSVVNNVETLCCVPHIVERGPEWFRQLGKAADTGTKIYAVSGRVKGPGCYELPMGTTLREILDEHADGMSDGHEFKAALPGGASSMFLDASQMDVPLEFESLAQIGCYFGTGGIIVLSDRSCIVRATQNLMQFFARESCGWCTPCRDGLPWLAGALSDIEEGRGKPGDADLLAELAGTIGGNTFCALALGAVASLESGLEKFRAEYDDHVRLGQCPLQRAG
jgi:NADH-quinone oxidoreductase subunit F